MQTEQDEIIVEISDQILDESEEVLERSIKEHGRETTRKAITILGFRFGLGWVMNDLDTDTPERSHAARLGRKMTTPVAVPPSEFRENLENLDSEGLEDLEKVYADMSGPAFETMVESMLQVPDEYDIEEYVKEIEQYLRVPRE